MFATIVNKPSSAWIAHAKWSDGSRLRLWCLPFAGGSAQAYRHWGGLLPADVELLPVELPGRATRFAEPAIASVTTIAAQLDEVVAEVARSLPSASDVLFGHSFGALIALEVARLMERRGAAARLLVVSGHLAPDHEPRAAPIGDLDDADLLRELGQLGGIPREVLDAPEVLEVVLPALRADIRAAESYHAAPDQALRCPILALGGLRDPTVPVRELQGWARYTSERLQTKTYVGDHFFVNRQGPAILRAVLAAVVGTPS
jgi:surfactin synthase thioesterase subunit